MGLQKEREQANQLITCQNHAYRDSYDGSSDPLVETCQRDVCASDHYVLILGEGYGTRRGEYGGKSVTELEFESNFPGCDRPLVADGRTRRSRAPAGAARYQPQRSGPLSGAPLDPDRAATDRGGASAGLYLDQLRRERKDEALSDDTVIANREQGRLAGSVPELMLRYVRRLDTPGDPPERALQRLGPLERPGAPPDLQERLAEIYRKLVAKE